MKTIRHSTITVKRSLGTITSQKLIYGRVDNDFCVRRGTCGTIEGMGWRSGGVVPLARRGLAASAEL